MALLKVVGSGSSGNSYIVECDNEILLIELGMPWRDILKSLNYDIKNVTAAIVSHQHLDHANKDTIRKAIQYGIPVYSCLEVAETYKGVKELKKGKKVDIGGFKIQPIPLYHNAMNYGFIIENKEFGKAIFCTDTNKIPYLFKEVNHLWIEANYSDDIMVNNLCDNVYSQSASENHMEINDTIDFLKNNYNSKIQSVVLLHLSNGNSNAYEFVKKTKDGLGFNEIYVAEKNLIVPLCKEEF